MAARRNVHARSANSGALSGALTGASLAVAVLCTAASAEVRVVDAGGGQLVVEAHDATVQQVVDALGQTGAIQFQTSEALSRPVTGTYSGTLRRVLSRILDGYDHVIRTTASGIRVDVVGTPQSGKVGAAAGPTMTAAGPGPRVAPRVSRNIDADEEAFQSKPAPAAGPQTVNLASGPRLSAAPPIKPPRPGVMGNAPHPRVSGNVDADEESAR